MCLNLKSEKTKIKIAKKDIIVYKGLYNLSEKDLLFTKVKHGDSFKGVIGNIECEGKISIDRCNKIYLCTDNSKLRGNIADDMLGYEYSWYLDNSVSEIIVNNELVFGERKYIPMATHIVNTKIFKTPYQYAIVEMGETYTSGLIKEDDEVYVGLHSFETLREARKISDIVAKCIIPKGSRYYKGAYDDDISYASDKITYLEIVE